jgi:hypothetical protein
MSINFPPRYPLSFEEVHASLRMETETGKEERYPNAYWPNRAWDLTYFSSTRSGDVDTLRDFLSRQQKDNKVFLFKEPILTSRSHVKLGHGTGSRTKWLVPVFDATSWAFFSNSVAVGASVNTGAGTASLSIVTFDSAPAQHFPVEISYVQGYYVPMVRLLEVFAYQVDKFDGIGNIMFSLIETKQDYPEA